MLANQRMELMAKSVGYLATHITIALGTKLALDDCRHNKNKTRRRVMCVVGNVGRAYMIIKFIGSVHALYKLVEYNRQKNLEDEYRRGAAEAIERKLEQIDKKMWGEIKKDIDERVKLQKMNDDLLNKMILETDKLKVKSSQKPPPPKDPPPAKKFKKSLDESGQPVTKVISSGSGKPVTKVIPLTSSEESYFKYPMF